MENSNVSKIIENRMVWWVSFFFTDRYLSKNSFSESFFRGIPFPLTARAVRRVKVLVSYAVMKSRNSFAMFVAKLAVAQLVSYSAQVKI